MTGRSGSSAYGSDERVAPGPDPYYRALPLDALLVDRGPALQWLFRTKAYMYYLLSVEKVKRKCSVLLIPSIPPTGLLLFVIGMYLLVFYGMGTLRSSGITLAPKSNRLRQESETGAVLVDLPAPGSTPWWVRPQVGHSGGNLTEVKPRKLVAIRRLPSALIIGARKAGTRALIRFLSLHPHVRAAEEEMHFFDREENFARGLTWYCKQMPVSYEDEVTIEKTPSYFIYPYIPYRVYNMNASIRLILVVRDPVERAISDYTQTYSRKTKQGLPYPRFESLAINKSSHKVNIQYRPIYRSMYSMFFPRWLKWFPRNQIHVVHGEKLAASPLGELQKVETFLGLRHRISESDFYFNKTRGFHCVMRGGRQECLSASKGRRHPRVDPQVRQQLARFYDEHNKRFYRLVGHDFRWGIK